MVDTLETRIDPYTGKPELVVPPGSAAGRKPVRGREVFKPVERENAEFPMTAADARCVGRPSNRRALVQNIAWALERDIKPSLDVVEALLSRTVRDMRWSSSIGEDEIDVPWPATANAEQPRRLPELYEFDPHDYHEYVVPPSGSRNAPFPDGLSDNDNQDALEIATFTLMARLDAREKVEAVRWALGLTDEALLLEPDDSYLINLFDVIEQSANKDELYTLVADHIYEHRQDYNYRIHESNYRIDSPIDELVWEICFSSHGYEPIIKYIDALEDAQKAKILLGILIDGSSFPRAINCVRGLVDNPGTPAELRLRLERIGRMMLGKDPDDTSIPFHATIEAFYHAFHIGDYVTNQVVTQYELDLLQKGLEADIGIAHR
ncbi:hypothetical protein FJY90_04935, partial [Candidatus Gottesmanbacteria bacterium]|nr:hypothetical protein [Candidatus Gottesmanbacteria bacterium]